MQVPSVKQIMAALAVLENKPKDADKARASKMGFMKNPFKVIRLKNVSTSGLERKKILIHKVTMG
jgi:hypothetical protein